ncbi:alpha/beta hydrolase [Ectobacillus sp. JY-23]|uniref:alpha/beta hydrolase n=1 Tax=Ectobacillus sp. JY-23 TaxID=2933872 RepID=UPI001FF45D7C|nr:alpha/beta hydrolase [Ectobacillus sp. JY-23]UOY91626.1 alpha/beta hydrolase [Ectobacillus sp. JY-23]
MIREENIKILSAYELGATLTFPATEDVQSPAILLIPGTGGSDRDGNKGGLDMNLYKDLAHFFTQQGFVTLRYDKRGMHESRGDAYACGMWDMVDDAAACLRFLKTHPQVNPNRIIIFGHSEGCILGTALQIKEPASGLIMVGGGAMSLKEAIDQQRESAFVAMQAQKGFKGWLFRTLKAVEKAKKQNAAFDEKVLNSTEDTIKMMGKKLPAKWLREHYSYDICADLASVTCPTLVISGSKDLQAPIEGVLRVEKLVQGEVETHIIPNMTHILKIWDGEIDGLNLMKVYKEQVNQPIDETLLQVLENWLLRYKGAKSEWLVNQQ